MTRLENVTKRLESVPTKLKAQTQETAVQTKTPSPKRPNRSSGESPRPEVKEEISTVQTTLPEVKAMSVASYEEIMAGPVSEYLKLSQKIGGDVASHSKLVDKAFQ